jgi:hypothetical protein
MKVIFLDFDGVLNSWAWLEECAKKYPNRVFGAITFDPLTHIDEGAVAVLEDVVKKSGAVVVISSTWRKIHHVDDIRSFLKTKGFTGSVIDITPTLYSKRGLEIQKWLDQNPQVTDFVIIDDDSDMEHLMHKLVQTHCDFGLQPQHTNAILANLGVNNGP